MKEAIDISVFTHNIVVPKIIRLPFSPFISDVIIDALDLMFIFFAISNGLICSVTRASVVFVKLLEILDVVNVVGNLHASARNANAVFRNLRLFLLLGTCTVL
jgi:hypothetical protein